MTQADSFDAVVIGAGIVGAAVAAELARRRPGWRLLVAEKEAGPAFHQTGRNSGVVHSGVYYVPGSLKARFCREGVLATRAFCTARGLPYDARGKLIVATDAAEVDRLAALQARAADNGIEVQALDAAGLRQVEPAVSGLAALRVPSTAITDYGAITRALLAESAAEVRLNAPVTAIDRQGDTLRLTVGGQGVEAGMVVACTGLSADRVARMAGVDPGVRILPFRGEYFVLPGHLTGVVHHLIYPVPDPALPFLGVHLTPMIGGTIEVGPNAILSLARENYGRFGFDPRDAGSALSYAGLWRMLWRYRGAVAAELRGTLSRRAYLAAVRKYCPQITLSDLATYRSAVRAQAMRPDGTLVDDFLIRRDGGLALILNAPSPAATSALPIATHICDLLLG